jgi:hypothetical protein
MRLLTYAGDAPSSSAAAAKFARRVDKYSEVLRQNIVHEVCSPKSRVVGFRGNEKGLVCRRGTR